MKIFFVTDIHGSNVCYRKFLNALRIYDVDVGILLGDLTGKVLVPLVEKAGGGWETTFMGHPVEVQHPGGAGQAQKDDRDGRLLLGPPDARRVPRATRPTRSSWTRCSTS